MVMPSIPPSIPIEAAAPGLAPHTASTKHGCTPVRTLPAADDGWCKFAGTLYRYLSCVDEGSKCVNVAWVHADQNHVNFQGKRIPSF
jgi:hypothetical protein